MEGDPLPDAQGCLGAGGQREMIDIWESDDKMLDVAANSRNSPLPANGHQRPQIRLQVLYVKMLPEPPGVHA